MTATSFESDPEALLFVFSNLSRVTKPTPRDPPPFWVGSGSPGVVCLRGSAGGRTLNAVGS